jgi:hypothetical protein
LNKVPERIFIVLPEKGLAAFENDDAASQIPESIQAPAGGEKIHVRMLPVGP